MNVRDRQSEDGFKITVLPPLKKASPTPMALSNPFGKKLKPNLSDHSKISMGQVENNLDLTNIGIIIGLLLFLVMLRLSRHQCGQIKSKILVKMNSMQ